MRTILPLAVLAVLLRSTPSPAAVQFDLSDPPAMVSPGGIFNLNVILQPSPEAGQILAANMRLKASSTDILALVGISSLPPAYILIWPFPPLGPLDPYSGWFGWTSDTVFDPPPTAPTSLIGMSLQVDSAAPQGLYVLELTDVTVADRDFNAYPAIGDSISLQIVPEPGTLTLLLLGLISRRRRTTP